MYKTKREPTIEEAEAVWREEAKLTALLLLITVIFPPVWIVILILQVSKLARIRRRDFQVEVGVCRRKFMGTSMGIDLGKKSVPMLEVIYDMERLVNVVVKASVYKRAKEGSSVIIPDYSSKGIFANPGVGVVVYSAKRES